jgi:IS5 family transposase
MDEQVQQRDRKLRQYTESLERMGELVDFAALAAAVDAACPRPDRSKGGRLPYLWLFKQHLVTGGPGAQGFFDAVQQQLQAHGCIPRGGQIVDATIKARWTKKHGKSHFGYKLHANVDVRCKLIRRCKVTPANVDDGNTLPVVVDRANTAVRLYGDRGYDHESNRGLPAKQGLRDGMARKARPGRKLGLRTQARNRAINRKRLRVEHVFAQLHHLGGKVVRAVTLVRNELAIVLKCAVCNARRLAWLKAYAGLSDARPRCVCKTPRQPKTGQGGPQTRAAGSAGSRFRSDGTWRKARASRISPLHEFLEVSHKSQIEMI